MREFGAWYDDIAVGVCLRLYATPSSMRTAVSRLMGRREASTTIASTLSDHRTRDVLLVFNRKHLDDRTVVHETHHGAHRIVEFLTDREARFRVKPPRGIRGEGLDTWKEELACSCQEGLFTLTRWWLDNGTPPFDLVPCDLMLGVIPLDAARGATVRLS